MVVLITGMASNTPPDKEFFLGDMGTCVTKIRGGVGFFVSLRYKPDSKSTCGAMPRAQ